MSRHKFRRLRVADEGINVEVGGALGSELSRRVAEDCLIGTRVVIDLTHRQIARPGLGDEGVLPTGLNRRRRSLVPVNASVRSRLTVLA